MTFRAAISAFLSFVFLPPASPGAIFQFRSPRGFPSPFSTEALAARALWADHSETPAAWRVRSEVAPQMIQAFNPPVSKTDSGAVKVQGALWKNRVPHNRQATQGQYINAPVQTFERAPDLHGGQIPLHLEVSYQAIMGGVQHRTIEKALDAVSRKDLHGAIEFGRSLIMPLDEDEWIHMNGKIYGALKLKATSYEGGVPVMAPYLLPPTQSTRSVFFDTDGHIYQKASRVHPRGGGLLDEATHEFTVMKQAFDSGVPTGFPIGVGEFISLRFQNERVGWLMIAIEDPEDPRVGDLWYQTRNRARRTDSPNRGLALEELRQKTLGMIQDVARTLRSFHEHGFTHTHPHFNQFTPVQSGPLIISDFTNARFVAGMHPDEFILRLFCDIHSCFWNLSLLSELLDEATLLRLEEGFGEASHYLMNLFLSTYLGADALRWAEKERFRMTNPLQLFEKIMVLKGKTGYKGQSVNDFNIPLIHVMKAIGTPIYVRYNRLPQSA